MALMVPSSRFSLGNDSLCAFDVPSEKHGEFHFNLCPLWSAREKEKKVITVIIDEDTPPTHTQYVYKIARIGASFWDTTLPAELQCPEGSWVCLTVINTRPDRPSEPQKILQVVPVANFAESNPIGVLQTGDDNRHDIQVALHGGKYQAKKHKALFKFKCDPKSNENTEPEYLWNFNGTHAFSWKSKYACASMHATPVPPTKTPPGAPDRPTPKPTPGDRDSEPPDKPPTEGEEDWEPVTTPGSGRLHGSRLNVLGVLVFLVLVGLVLRRLFRSTSSSTSSNFLRFRSALGKARMLLILPAKKSASEYQPILVEEEMDVLDGHHPSPSASDQSRYPLNGKGRGRVPNYGL